MLNWVDLVILVVLLLFLLEGVGKSFVSEFLDFLSFLLAFFLSYRFYNEAASLIGQYFQLPPSFANVLGFIAVWFLIEIIFFVAVHLLIFRIRIFLSIDRFLNPVSFIPGFLRGLIFVAILLVLVGTFPIQPRVKTAVQESKIGSFILAKAHQLEIPLKNVFGGIGEDTLSFLTIKPKSNERVDLGFQTNDFKPDESLEKKMIGLVNLEREKAGFKKLEYREELKNLGRLHSGDMFKRGYFAHYSPENKNVADRADENKVDYLVIGENLAYAPDLNLAHKGLMNSPGHRANILSLDFGKIGIGIMDGGVYGLMITQVFSN